MNCLSFCIIPVSVHDIPGIVPARNKGKKNIAETIRMQPGNTAGPQK